MAAEDAEAQAREEEMDEAAAMETLRQLPIEERMDLVCFQCACCQNLFLI
jgi:hypothetical protein